MDVGLVGGGGGRGGFPPKRGRFLLYAINFHAFLPKVDSGATIATNSAQNGHKKRHIYMVPPFAKNTDFSA